MFNLHAREVFYTLCVNKMLMTINYPYNIKTRNLYTWLSWLMGVFTPNLLSKGDRSISIIYVIPIIYSRKTHLKDLKKVVFFFFSPLHTINTWLSRELIINLLWIHWGKKWHKLLYRMLGLFLYIYIYIKTQLASYLYIQRFILAI